MWVRVPPSVPIKHLFEFYLANRYKYHSKKDDIFLNPKIKNIDHFVVDNKMVEIGKEI